MFSGVLRRCYQCRSRGDLGSCKDPFKLNITQIDDVHGVTAVPCASGWCGKVIESEGTLKEDGKLIITICTYFFYTAVLHSSFSSIPAVFNLIRHGLYCI